MGFKRASEKFVRSKRFNGGFKGRQGEFEGSIKG